MIYYKVTITIAKLSAVNNKSQKITYNKITSVWPCGLNISL